MPPEPKVPSPNELLWPAVVAIKEDGSATNEELLERVIELQDISDAVQNIMHRGSRTKLDYNLAWAKTWLKKWGAIENPSWGVWAITDKGKMLTQDQVQQIPIDLRKLYKKEVSKDGKEEDLPPEREGWKDDLLEVLKKMDPKAFERLAKRILLQSNFVQVDVTGRSGDGGIDGVGVFRLQLLTFRVYFQCKKYKDTVPAKEIRDFRGAMAGRSDKGLLITTGVFTREATSEANRVAPPIDLIDGDRLCDILKELKLGVSTTKVQTENVSIDAAWFSNI